MASQHRVTNVDRETLTGTCQKCGPVPVTFVKNSRGYQYARCRIAMREQAKRKRARIGKTEAHLRYHREYRRRTKFKLPPGGVEALIEAAGGQCQICSDPVDLQTAQLDHDHSCCNDHQKTCGACFRGVLCRGCNTGLGLFRDDPDRLLAAINYLEGVER